MTNDEAIKRYAKLSQRAAERSIYTETPFLTEGEKSALVMEKMPLRPRFFGGYDEAERCIAVFGSKEDFGYEWESPIRILKISPKMQKYADALTHRDFLGALLNLGIKREMLGDILILENCAYLFILEKMADFVMENLVRVRHTDVKISLCEALPDGIGANFEEKTVIAPSPRADALVAAVFDLSREEGKALVEKERVSVSGVILSDPSKEIGEGVKVSVRGYGKFYFDGAIGETRSGRCRMKIRLFI